MNLGHRVTRPLIQALDLTLAAVAAVALVILVTGGGRLTLLGHVIDAHRARNPLLVLFALGGVRLLAAHQLPFLSRWSLGGAERLTGRLRSWLQELTPDQAGRADGQPSAAR